jgi:hypothetical protein
MTTLKNSLETIKALFGNISALVIFAALYALLLVTLYFYIATREATVWQVMITLAGLVVIPAEFFVLQAAIVNRTQHDAFDWRCILRDALKFFVVTVPILIVGYVLWILLNKWQVHYPPALITLAQSANKLRPTHWPSLWFATARCLIFGVALPLVTIQLWIECAGRDLKTLFTGFLKRLGSVFTRACSADSVFTYALGLVLFVAIPYALLFIPITIKGNKTEFTFFSFRLVLVFVFTLVGWIVTVQALARNAARAPEAPRTVAPSVSPTAPSEVLSPQSGPQAA